MSNYYLSPAGDVAVSVPPWAHECGQPTKSGQPCRRWVLNKFLYCQWHNGAPRTREARKTQHLEDRRQRTMKSLVYAQALEAATLAGCEGYKSMKHFNNAMRVRRRYANAAEAELKAIDAALLGLYRARLLAVLRRIARQL